MPNKMQERINEIKYLASVADKTMQPAEPKAAPSSLSKVIRNSKEAERFMNDLNNSFRLAAKK
ncbi:hypothetical protein [Ferruginibacter sp. HRS2-29]|uniref:hypothetical protein n=1 Tax=Ferruginibacter sp. HRS2-29 TaxID=2487334 RepID=UPI0020CCF278|nr:hypothetical protein [Ferruginibacter sp. HRS2-29]MCP9753252.1 hypothetical protein [Ferruginibacter sp. HRS2-29]